MRYLVCARLRPRCEERLLRALVDLLKAPTSACADLRSKPRELWPLIASKLDYTPATVEKSWPQLRYAGTIAKDLLAVMVEEERWVAKERNRTPRSREELAKPIDGSLLEEARRGARR